MYAEDPLYAPFEAPFSRPFFRRPAGEQNGQRQYNMSHGKEHLDPVDGG